MSSRCTVICVFHSQKLSTPSFSNVAAVLWFPQAWEDDLQVIVELSYGGLLSHGTPDISSQTTSSSSYNVVSPIYDIYEPSILEYLGNGIVPNHTWEVIVAGYGFSKLPHCHSVSSILDSSNSVFDSDCGPNMTSGGEESLQEGLCKVCQQWHHRRCGQVNAAQVNAVVSSFFLTGQVTECVYSWILNRAAGFWHPFTNCMVMLNLGMG